MFGSYTLSCQTAKHLEFFGYLETEYTFLPSSSVRVENSEGPSRQDRVLREKARVTTLIQL